MKKKLRAGLLIACMLLAPLNTYGAVLHTIRETQTITKGATMIKDQLLTDAGWQDLYVLKVNLNDANIALKPIGADKLGEKQTLMQIAEREGALAAINADFFGMSSNVPSFGPMISAGEVIQAYNNNHVAVGPADNMATLLIDDLNNIMMNYFSIRIDILGNGVKMGEANAYNKIGTYVNRPIILDRQYMQSTAAVAKQYTGIHTIVVDNGEVVRHTQPGEVVTIPENGFIMIMDKAYADNYYKNLPIGSKVTIDVKAYLGNQLTNNLESIQLGIGGGGLLMKDGEIYTGKSNVVSPATRNPRSVVATTFNPNEILLVALDGRGKSLGATHQELVALLKRYGVKDAMYLDGGGSTTLVAREQGNTNVTLQNVPSDGAQRRIMNGIGIFSTAPIGEVAQLYIDTPQNRTFVGEPIQLKVRATDSNSNPVSINMENVSFEIVGVEGRMEGTTFYPATEGKALIVAKIGEVQVAKEIMVSQSPKGIVIEPTLINMNPGESKTVQVYGVDAGGYKLPITPSKLTWQNVNGIVTAEGNTIRAGATGTTTLVASYGDVSAKVSVVVGDNVSRLESFEAYTPKWGGNAGGVSGSVQPCTDLKFHGERSVKMAYTFQKSTNKQVASTVFDQPLQLPNDANSFNVWVSGRKQGDTLKVEVVDAKGKKYDLKLTEAVDFEGWKYLSVPLPEDIEMPAKVTKLYAYAQQVPEKRTTALYFDHLSATRGERERAGITVRADYRFDPMYRTSLESPKENEYVINVTGPTKNNSLTLSQQHINGMRSKLLKDASKVILASTQNTNLQLGDKGASYQNSYAAMMQGNTQIMFVGTGNGGIRKTNMNQWTQMKQTLENTSAQHVIMVMSHNPLTQFTDAREGKALHEYLVEYKEKTGKNIFVVTPGGMDPEVKIESGIRYIRTPGIVGPADDIEKGSFVKFKVMGDSIYYTFESML